MVPKVERINDCAHCRQCKHYRGSKPCIMADVMSEEERKAFVEKESAGCYWFDSIRWG